MSSRLAPLRERLGKAGRIGSNINVCEGNVGFTAEMLGSAAGQQLSDVLRILLVVEHYFMSLLQRLRPRLPLQEVVPFKLLDQARTSQWVKRLKLSRCKEGIESLLLHLRLLPFSQVFVLRLEIILGNL
jgi:hypothetical protein